MVNTEPGAIALEIKTIRKKLKLTQEEFAQKLGITRATVNRYENGHLVPRTYKYLEILKFKNIPARNI